jgi:hypothetical protein
VNGATYSYWLHAGGQDAARINLSRAAFPPSGRQDFLRRTICRPGFHASGVAAALYSIPAC